MTESLISPAQDMTEVAPLPTAQLLKRKLWLLPRLCAGEIPRDER